MKKSMPLVLPFIFMMYLSGYGTESASIGMIGGADGPTAVFVSSTIHWPYVLGAIGVIGATVLVILISRSNNKKK